MMFMMQWSRPAIYNVVRGLARHMSVSKEAHVKVMTNAIKHIVATRNRGLVLAPDAVWDGGKSFNNTFEFRIHGRSDSDCAANTDDRKKCFRRENLFEWSFCDLQKCNTEVRDTVG